MIRHDISKHSQESPVVPDPSTTNQIFPELTMKIYFPPRALPDPRR